MIMDYFVRYAVRSLSVEYFEKKNYKFIMRVNYFFDLTFSLHRGVAINFFVCTINHQILKYKHLYINTVKKYFFYGL